MLLNLQCHKLNSKYLKKCSYKTVRTLSRVELILLYTSEYYVLSLQKKEKIVT